MRHSKFNKNPSFLDSFDPKSRKRIYSVLALGGVIVLGSITNSVGNKMTSLQDTVIKYQDIANTALENNKALLDSLHHQIDYAAGLEQKFLQVSFDNTNTVEKYMRTLNENNALMDSLFKEISLQDAKISAQGDSLKFYKSVLNALGRIIDYQKIPINE